MPVDMFDEMFVIQDMKATGKISYAGDEVDLLSASIIQMDSTGKIIGGAYGASTDVEIDDTRDPDQPTWELEMRMMPGGPGKRLKAAVPATGLALYRRRTGNLSLWVTEDIVVTEA